MKRAFCVEEQRKLMKSYIANCMNYVDDIKRHMFLEMVSLV